MDNEALERISFLFPFKVNESGVRQPVLIYDVPEMPHPVDISVAVFFIGLVSERLYRVDLDIISNDGKTLNDDFERQKLFKVRSTIDGESIVSASFEVQFKGVKIPVNGVYCVAASLHTEGVSSLVSTNHAYFEVKARGHG
ncbi:hypothetical protein [Erwinia aphidicola]|uniref:hypothetical protein n=1 Tax=Erwinia aphidicola TaxID=68334 RepID=UPI0030D4B101